MTIKNTLILVRITFLDRTDIEFSNKINFTVIHIVYKRRIGRYAIMWPQNDPDKWNLFFFITRITIRPEISKKKNNPTLYKSNNNISWQKRRGHWKTYVKNAVNTDDNRSKTTMIEKNKRPPWKVKCQS